MTPRRPFLQLPRKALQAAALLGDAQAAKVLKRMSDNFRNTVWVLTIGATLVVGSIVVGRTIVDYHAATSAVEEAQTRATQQTDMARMKYAAELRQMWVRSCRVTPDQAEELVSRDQSAASTPPLTQPRKE